MRNDYVGFGILKDIVKYRQKLLSLLIKDSMNIEQKTAVRIYVNNLSYKDLIKQLKQVS